MINTPIEIACPKCNAICIPTVSPTVGGWYMNDICFRCATELPAVRMV